MPMRRRRSEEEMLAEEEDDTVIEKVSRPITLDHMHKILTNPFYTGKILAMDGGYIESKSHEPLISDALFYQVQKQLCRRNVSVRYTDKVPLLHRGFVRCEKCNRVYTPYLQKGILYFGSRCLKGCANTKRNFNLSFLEEKIGTIISTLIFTEDELTWLNAQTTTSIAVLEERRDQVREADDRQKKKLREDLSYLRLNKLNLLKVGVYTPETMGAEENRLSTEITSLQVAEQIPSLRFRIEGAAAFALPNKRLRKHTASYPQCVESNPSPSKSGEVFGLWCNRRMVERLRAVALKYKALFSKGPAAREAPNQSVWSEDFSRSTCTNHLLKVNEVLHYPKVLPFE